MPAKGHSANIEATQRIALARDQKRHSSPGVGQVFFPEQLSESRQANLGQKLPQASTFGAKTQQASSLLRERRLSVSDPTEAVGPLRARYPRNLQMNGRPIPGGRSCRLNFCFWVFGNQ